MCNCPQFGVENYFADHINGIGNRSREQYICKHNGCALRVMVEVDDFVEFYVHWY